MILRVERKNVCRISVEEAKEAGSDLPGMVFGDAVMLLGEPIISETFGKSNPCASSAEVAPRFVQRTVWSQRN